MFVQLVIAAITSCTNTSNPSVMLGAGLLAKKAVERGLDSAPYVKTKQHRNEDEREAATVEHLKGDHRKDSAYVALTTSGTS